MKKPLSTILSLVFLLSATQMLLGVADDGAGSRSDALIDSHKNTNLISVVFKSVGKQRIPIKPIVLYTEEMGWNIRRWALNPPEEKLVSGEKCERSVLDKLFVSAKAGQDWVSEGEYGNTQVTFFRADALQQSFTLGKDQITLAVQSVKGNLPTNSIVWHFLGTVNRFSTPPAKK